MGADRVAMDLKPQNPSALVKRNAVMDNIQNYLTNDDIVTLTSFKGEVQINKQATTFINNTYSNISIGVCQKIYSEYYRGSLHKFQSVMALDMKGENYTNILAFTYDHILQVYLKIFNENAKMYYKGPIPYS